MTRHFIVVYQYGKVASTSLVATLNALPGIEAVQAHFLGRDSLRDMVAQLVDPAIGDYFHRHQLGQFVENARTTRRINAHRQGLGTDSALSIISLHRDPFDWLRSSLLQDMVAYRPVLGAMPPGPASEVPGDAGRIRAGLEQVFASFCAIIDDFGDIDALLDRLGADGRALAACPALAGNRELLGLFHMMLRPFSWFEAHYRPAIGYAVDDLAEVEAGVRYRDVGWASLAVLRYEDLEAQIGAAARRLGIGAIGALARENESGGKDMVGPVREAFASEAAGALRARFCATSYARRFGYAQTVAG